MLLRQAPNEKLAEIWYQRKIVGTYKHPEVVERVLRRYIKPLIGKLPVNDVRANHVDLVLTKIVDAGAPTVANDALRYLVRMFHFAVKRRLIETNPAYGFDLSDAGRAEAAGTRWLKKEELAVLAGDMKATHNFGRLNELAVWLLLALCVRKMELLSAKWADFDLDAGVWHFTVHDMRRTARTQMAALGIDRFVAERALNHKIRAVEGIYDQHDYFDERKLALGKWATLLAALAKV